MASAGNVYDFSAVAIDGRAFDFASLRGKVLLVFNTASECGYTSQLVGLEGLWRHYRARGLAVVGFPCNQFGSQEPAPDATIADFCQLTYNVTFPLMSKIAVNGRAAHPLWKFLKSEAPGVLGTRMVKWNFTKFLVGRDGEVIRRYAPKTPPAELRADIEAALAA